MWFTGGRKSSAHFTYTARRESGAKVLVLSAENYLGGVPAQDPDGPHYLTYYTDALDELGVDYDIYDVERRGNRSPDRARRAEPLRRGDLVHAATTTSPACPTRSRAPARRASRSRR